MWGWDHPAQRGALTNLNMQATPWGSGRPAEMNGEGWPWRGGGWPTSSQVTSDIATGLIEAKSFPLYTFWCFIIFHNEHVTTWGHDEKISFS